MLHAALVAALALTAPEAAPAQDASDLGVNSLVAAKEIRVDELLERPEPYLGQTLRVEGIVVDAGDRDGRWFALADDANGPRIRITLEQGAADLPQDVKGIKVAADGVLMKVKAAPGIPVEGDGNAPAPGSAYEIRSKRVTFEKVQ